MARKRKADWCALSTGAISRKKLESAAWNLTPKGARTLFASRRAISTDPPQYSVTIAALSWAQLNRYIKSRCQTRPPKGRYSNSVPRIK